MRKINTYINESLRANVVTKNYANTKNNPLAQLTQQAHAHQLLQQFWLSAAPSTVSQLSFATSLINGQLTIYASNAMVASKIKLNASSILRQLQAMQQAIANYEQYEVTAIIVKVQVKSAFKPAVKMPLKLSFAAANCLQNFAESLGEGALSQQLKSLANKT